MEALFAMGISTGQFNSIMKKYDLTRMRNRQLLDRRITAINTQIPEIEALQAQMIQLSFQQARLYLLHPEESSRSTEEYHQHMRELTKQKQDLLEQHGYRRDYLSPIYTCPDCKDTGYIGSRPCHCLITARSGILYANAGLEHVLARENFQTFQADYYDDTIPDKNLSLTPRQNILRLREVCLDFIRHFDDACDNLIFYGPTGVGKTFLAHCIAKELLDTGHTVVYLTSLQLFDMLEKNRFDRDEEAEDAHNRLDLVTGSELLIIDDLGTELTNSFTVSELYHLIEERHLRRHSVLLSTNLSFHDLHDRYGERIFSRFTGHYNFYKIIGEDIRPIKRFREYAPDPS